jgi:hypothetical protein
VGSIVASSVGAKQQGETKKYTVVLAAAVYL